MTGSNGFIAKNLIQFLSEQDNINILCFNRSSSENDLKDAVIKADWIIHLAGVNRPLSEQEFVEGNITLAVDTAVKEGRITADLAQTYKDLGAQNFELMAKTLESFPKKVDLKAGVTTPSGTTEPMTEENFQKLSTEGQLAWKEANPEEYKKLFS